MWNKFVTNLSIHLSAIVVGPLFSNYLVTQTFASKDDKPYSATFGQISTKSDRPFSS